MKRREIQRYAISFVICFGIEIPLILLLEYFQAPLHWRLGAYWPGLMAAIFYQRFDAKKEAAEKREALKTGGLS